MPQIEVYLIAKGWTKDAGQYRSPHGGKEAINLIDGEQTIINHLEMIERRDSDLICKEIRHLCTNT